MKQSLLARAVRAAGGPSALAREVGSERLAIMMRTWRLVARPAQIAPEGVHKVLWLAGRGWGKTGCLTGYVHQLVESGRYGRIAIVAPTSKDCRDVIVEGESGLKAWAPPGRAAPHYEPSKGRVTFWNGAQAFLYSAEEPDRLRGPQFHAAACDELAAWKYLADTWANLQFGLRLGTAPRIAIATTPRPLPLIKELNHDPSVRVIKGSTYENSANLAGVFLEQIKKYEGTRLGRQEIHAEILDDNPNALWKQTQIDALRLREAPELRRLIVAIDPAVSSNPDSDETGIIVAGVGMCRCKGPPEEHGFILEDLSGIYSPLKWADVAIAAFERWQADLIAAEVNNGGELVEANLRAHGRGRRVPYRAIHASRGKRLRHEPVSNLYERGIVHHLGALPKLEDQMVGWDPTVSKSPDRLDAATIAITDLMIAPERAPGRMGVTVIAA